MCMYNRRFRFVVGEKGVEKGVRPPSTALPEALSLRFLDFL